MNRHQLMDRRKWLPWAYLGDGAQVYAREYVVTCMPASLILVASNTTVILERMVRRGRAAFRNVQ